MPGDSAVPLRDYIQRVVGGGTPARSVDAFWNGTIPWASVKDFTEGELILGDTQEHVTERGVAASATNVIPAGTPIICTRMAVGRVALTTQATAINQDIKALFPVPSIDAKFLVHLLNLKRPQLEAVAIGSTVKGITLTDLLSLPWLPLSLPEQRRIAEILDTLDRTIESTQRIIDKLQATRQGLLHDLLTRGLDEHGQLRDPERNPEQFKETELGLLPREWEVESLDVFCDSVADGTHDSPKPQENGYPLITSKNLGKDGLNLDNVYMISEFEYKSIIKRSWVEKFDIIFAMIGTVGNPVIIETDSGLATKNVGILRFGGNKLRSRWALNSLNSNHMEKQIEDVVAGSTQRFIGLGSLRSLLIPVPQNLHEIKNINTTITAIDTRIQAEKARLNKLQALKRGLMDDLLTGRVRVPTAPDSE